MISKAFDLFFIYPILKRNSKNLQLNHGSKYQIKIYDDMYNIVLNGTYNFDDFLISKI